MPLRQADIWALELSDYFLKYHKYQLVTLSQETTQIWLVNESDKSAPILMITAQSTNDLNLDEVRQINETLSLLIKSEKTSIFITVNEDHFDANSGLILVTPRSVSNSQLVNQFPELQSHLKNSNNLVEARKTALASIQKRMKRARQKSFLTGTRGTIALILIALIGFFAIISLVSFGASLETATILTGAYYKPFIVLGYEWWRFVTPFAVHYSIIHLAFNCMALWNMGKILEPRLKTFKFLLIFILGVIMGNVFLFIRDVPTIGIGMSAGIYALMGALFVNMFETGMIKNPIIRNQLVSTVITNFMISLLPNVSFTAHLGGLYMGIFLGFIFSTRKDWAFLRKGMTVLLVVSSVGLLAIMFIRPGYVEPSMLDLDIVRTLYELDLSGYARQIERLVIHR